MCGSRDGTHVFVVEEIYGLGLSSRVSSFKLSVDTAGRKVVMTAVGEPVETQGTAGCFITLDRSERFLLCANYMSGSVICFKRSAEGGLVPCPTVSRALSVPRSAIAFPRDRRVLKVLPNPIRRLTSMVTAAT